MKIGVRCNPLVLKEDFKGLVEWLAENEFDAVDLMSPDPDAKAACDAAGIEIGSFDAPSLRHILTDDEEARSKAAKQMKDEITQAAKLGLKTLFCCFVPMDKTATRAKTFEIWKAVFPDIVAHCETSGINIAIEPWPGPPPHYPTIGCTPEMWRAMFEAIPSPALGLCYDPSHMVRIGVDYLRVLKEFGDRIHHVHAKDCAFLEEEMYVQGCLPRTFGKPAFKFSEGWWRYCKPGDGEVDWRAVVVGLIAAGKDDQCFSIELEDAMHAGSADLNKSGLLAAKEYLEGVIQ